MSTSAGRPASSADREGIAREVSRSGMRSQSLLALAALVLYPAVSLWPYQWHAARVVENGAVPLPGGGLRFASPGIALADGAPAWLAPALATHRLELSLRVRSLAREQSGPARILTFST